MSWPCFVVTELDEMEVHLRRYTHVDAPGECPLEFGYHNASVPIGRHTIARNDRGGYSVREGKGEYADDERWPTHCPCGYAFTDDDVWQIHPERIWRADDGREFEMHDLPVGAMLRSDGWNPRAIPGPDGKVWSVALPPNGGHNLWCIDAPSSTGGRWTRTGDAPNVTVNPSILTDRYHGWLHGGVLSDSLPDRPLA